MGCCGRRSKTERGESRPRRARRSRTKRFLRKWVFRSQIWSVVQGFFYIAVHIGILVGPGFISFQLGLVVSHDIILCRLFWFRYTISTLPRSVNSLS
jgi:hypothetical protein